MVHAYDLLRGRQALQTRTLRVQAVQWLDHPAQRDLGAECWCLCSLLAGQAMLLALTGVREMRGRLRFLQVCGVSAR
jgi:hypothetical protein